MFEMQVTWVWVILKNQVRVTNYYCMTDFDQSPSYRQYKIAVLQIDLGEVNPI